MPLLALNIGIVECDAHAACKAHYDNMNINRPPQEEIDALLAKLKDHTFFRCRVTLGEKTMQLESPSTDDGGRQSLLAQTMEQCWKALRKEAFTKEANLIIAG